MTVPLLDNYGVDVTIVRLDNGHLMSLGCNIKDASCSLPLAGETGAGGVTTMAKIYAGTNYMFNRSGGGVSIYFLIESR